MKRLRVLASLRYRFTLVMLAASLSFGVVVTGLTWVEGHRALERHTRESALTTLQAFARPAADRLLTEDDLRLRELVSGMLGNNDQWLQVMVVDGSGQVRARLTPKASHGPEEFEDAHEIRTVLLDPRIGTMSALVSRGADRRSAVALVYRLAFALFVLTLLGLATAWLLGHWLTRDLERLVVLVERIGEGELGLTLPHAEGHDEVAVLTRALNRASRNLGEARQALAEQQAHLVETEKLAAVGSLAAGVAHEVANPVGGAINCLQRLARPDLTDERRERYRQLALDAVERAAVVLRGLLHLARGASPGRGFAPEEMTVADAVEQPSRMASVGAGIPVVVAGGEAIAVRWPRGAVEQILTNLLLNATKAARVRVEVGWRREGDNVVIEISDDGPGLPAKLAARVFEPFFSTRPPGQGTGLGLPVARSIARSLGGDVGLRGGIEAGAVAWLRLPLTIDGSSDAA